MVADVTNVCTTDRPSLTNFLQREENRIAAFLGPREESCQGQRLSVKGHVMQFVCALRNGTQGIRDPQSPTSPKALSSNGNSR